MKHILAIIGSPRKGETLQAVQRLEEEMKKLDEIQFEYAMLSELKLADCLGCHNWPEMFGVRFFGLATGGGMFKGVFKELRTNVSSWGGVWVGNIGVPHYESLTVKYRAKQDKEFAKQAAVLLKAAADKSLPRPALGRLMMYRMWKMNASLGFCPKDKESWAEKGWLDPKCRYYYETKVNPLKNAIAAAAMDLARRFMRSVYVGY